MSTHTDTCTITYNEDGSKTIETTETVYPLTKAQKASAWGALTLVALAPVAPLLIIGITEKVREKRAARKENQKKLASVD